MESRDLGLPSRWFASTFRVRYQESDQMGVVYHANYLNWFESGRTEMFRQLGFTYRGLESKGILLPVTAADLQFKSPARYDDRIAIYARLTTFTALRVVYEYEVRLLSQEEDHGNESSSSTEEQESLPNPLHPSGKLLVNGSTSHVWLNKDWRPTRLDRALPELFQAITGVLRQEGSSV
ncbi:acyl-CoA thioesterase [Paenibacillus monticola]|uniref:YbgC/FadM family acyl-CoA thioesterase n=1 Tax=Paenibacillus monticola TaxID=2666075 RepID=A0A7X2L137_9BACL|nr:thioesterase family protein [Paenibacillus monticola]MRN52974.1 YbgC/FadM family acyl-CoA thioesterase [Paenibacillus monticola]